MSPNQDSDYETEPDPSMDSDDNMEGIIMEEDISINNQPMDINEGNINEGDADIDNEEPPPLIPRDQNDSEGDINEDNIGVSTGANRQAGRGVIPPNAQQTLENLPPRMRARRDRLVRRSDKEGFLLLEGTAHGGADSSVGTIYRTIPLDEVVEIMYEAKVTEHCKDVPSAAEMANINANKMNECINYLREHFRCFLGLTEKEIFDMYVEIKNQVDQKRFKLNLQKDKVSKMGYNKMNPYDDVLNVYDETHLALYISGCRLHGEDKDLWWSPRLSKDKKNKRDRVCSELGLEYTGSKPYRAAWIRNNIKPLFVHHLERTGVTSGRNHLEWRKHQSLSQLLVKCSEYFRPPGFAMGWWLNNRDMNRWFMSLIPEYSKTPWLQWASLYTDMQEKLTQTPGRGMKRINKILLLEYQICTDRQELVALLGARSLTDKTVKANRIDHYRNLFLSGMRVKVADMLNAPEAYHQDGVDLKILLDNYIASDDNNKERRFCVLLQAYDDIMKYEYMKENRHGIFLARMIEQECNECQVCQCKACENHATLVKTAAGMKKIDIFHITAHHKCEPWKKSQRWPCHEFATRYEQRYLEGKSLDTCEASNCKRCSPVFPDGVDFDHNDEKLKVTADAANYESRIGEKAPKDWSKSEHEVKGHLVKITCATTHANTSYEQTQMQYRDRLGISEKDVDKNVRLVLDNVKTAIHRRLVREYKNQFSCHISGNNYCKDEALDLHHPLERRDVIMKFKARYRFLKIKKEEMISTLTSESDFVDIVVHELIKVVPAQHDINTYLGYGVEYIPDDAFGKMDLNFGVVKIGSKWYNELLLDEETYKDEFEKFKASKDWHKPLHKREGTIFYRASEGDEDADMLGVGLDLNSDELQQDDNASTMMEDDETNRVPAAAQQVEEAMAGLQEDSVQSSDSMSVDSMSVDSMSVDSMSVDSTVSREELLYMTEVKNGTFDVEGKSIREYREMAIEAMIGIVKIENTYKLQRKVDPDLMWQLEDILGQISNVALYGYDNRKKYKHAAKLWEEFEELFNYFDDGFFTIQGNIIDDEGHCEGYVEPQREWIDVSKIKIGIWTRF